MPASKLTGLPDAVSSLVPDGSAVALGTAQETLIPFAAGHEIIRQRIRGLTLIGPISDILFDQIIGAGCVDKIRAAWVGNVITGSGYNFKRAVESGHITVEDHSILTLVTAFTAGKMGIPFMPTRSLVGSDMAKFNDENIKSIECPFTHTRVGVVKAVVPDIGIMHVQRADSDGNAQKWGTLGIDLEGINASKKIIITAEEIVDTDVIRRDPNRTIVPGFRVNAVVEQPFGAYPSHLAGCYNDGPMVFGTMMGGKEAYDENLQETVYGVNDWNEYLENLKKKNGADFLDKIRLKNPAMSDPIARGYETIGGNE